MSHGYEPKEIPGGGELAQAWGNGQLKDVFDRLDVTNSFDAREQYINQVNEWQEGVETFETSIKRAISEAWEGASADAANAAISNYAREAEGLLDPLQQLATHIDGCANAVLRTKHALPETVIVDSSSWWNPVHRFELEDRQGEHRQQAWEQFTHHYVKPLGDIDTQVPVLPLAAEPTHPVDTNSEASQSFSTSPAGPAIGDQTSSQPSDQQSSGQAADSSNTNQHAGGPAGNTTPPGSDRHDAGHTTPTVTGTATTPAGVDADPTTSGFGGTGRGGLGGTGSVGIPGGGSHSALPGRVLGAPAGPTAPGTPHASGAAETRTGTPGMAGMPGMAPPGRGNAEEKEHRSPHYLVDARNGQELIGALPDNATGVINSDHTRDIDDEDRVHAR